MKRTFFLAGTVAAVLILVSVPARTDLLGPMVGTWRSMLIYPESEGRITLTFVEATEIKWVAPDTVAFTMTAGTAGSGKYSASLRWSASRNKHFLNVWSPAGQVIRDLPMAYVKGSGLQGEGTLQEGGRSRTVKASVAHDSQGGGFQWTVLESTGTPPDIVLGFGFMEKQR